MKRGFNFSPGPGTLPLEVLEQAAEEMLDWCGTGMGVMEMSHRGKAFMSILNQAQDDLRELLMVPDNYKILFMQGGAVAENAIIPMNLLGYCAETPPIADYIVTGFWSDKSQKEARRYCNVNIAASSEGRHFTHLPRQEEWKLSQDPAYIHICTNETIHGVEYFWEPDLPGVGLPEVPLVADVSSHILSRPMDVSKFGVMYGGAQKNIGPSGMTFVIVREDLLDRALPICPSVFTWKTVAENNSMYNTPPTYAIYIAGLVFEWLKRNGGLKAMEKQNVAKAQLLYGYLDSSNFYCTFVEKDCRSRMNVPFFLHDDALNDKFFAGAESYGLLQLNGHSSVGGVRASIYNAMPLAGVQALVDYLRDFERIHG
ncbi:3-phosphoserine/phosphohydroxythreonine transaminase [Candidatus Pandoraea novymonadis]|uniref:Phosphoserine aminotransferase n=1 Tax=Candidatus Pandoraea novymonadis TaxID=1808959 RepID=A0ABX5FEW5_9BURK|nr:3-phosphoserine/phosphohydroxythreonine transaminase [Candidatus Pandoraea novymonadis]PSB92240.1 Phosphoserine aminotransferase [Candidatus Pandoraea novymonadis]